MINQNSNSEKKWFYADAVRLALFGQNTSSRVIDLKIRRVPDVVSRAAKDGHRLNVLA